MFSVRAERSCSIWFGGSQGLTTQRGTEGKQTVWEEEEDGVDWQREVCCICIAQGQKGSVLLHTLPAHHNASALLPETVPGITHPSDLYYVEVRKDLLSNLSSRQRLNISLLIWFIIQGLARWRSTCLWSTSTPCPQFWSYSWAPTLGFSRGAGIQTQIFLFVQ